MKKRQRNNFKNGNHASKHLDGKVLRDLPKEQHHRILPQGSWTAVAYGGHVQHFTPIPMLVNPYLNCPDRPIGNVAFSHEFNRQPFVHHIPSSVQLLRPADGASGQYKVIQPRPVLAYVLDNGPQLSPEFLTVPHYMSQCHDVNGHHFQQTPPVEPASCLSSEHHDVNGHNYQQPNGNHHYINEVPNYQPQQPCCYQPFIGHGVYHPIPNGYYINSRSHGHQEHPYNPEDPSLREQQDSTECYSSEPEINGERGDVSKMPPSLEI